MDGAKDSLSSVEKFRVDGGEMEVDVAAADVGGAVIGATEEMGVGVAGQDPSVLLTAERRAQLFLSSDR